jgi:2'-5' RNA ligase
VPRLFVAVYPPPHVVAALSALPRDDEEAGVRWVPVDQYHVTIRFLGNVDVDDAVFRLDAVVADLAPAEVALGPQVSRLGRNVVCVPASGLERLATAVGKATADIGEPPDPRPFRGHLTLARLRHRAACGITGTAFEARFVADQIDLVDSVTRPEGAQHSVLRSWSLDS